MVLGLISHVESAWIETPETYLYTGDSKTSTPQIELVRPYQFKKETSFDLMISQSPRWTLFDRTRLRVGDRSASHLVFLYQLH